MLAFIDIKQLQPHISKFFGIENITQVKDVADGYRCLNIEFENRGKKYFLKRYREGLYNSVDEVKRSEQLFFMQGVPVILPLLDCNSDPAFFFEDAWYSLFPFIDGNVLPASFLTPHHIASLGIMHAKLHQIGNQIDRVRFSNFSFWDRDVFLHEVEQVEQEINPDLLENKEEQLAFENLELQAKFVRSSNKLPVDFNLANDCLLHGDFIYTNIFFDEDGNIQHVYDFERTGIGPRAYDLARSIFISCFDDGWNEKNFEFARTYLKAYQTIYPIEREEFRVGVMMYVTHFMHMSWLETIVLLGKSTRHYPLVKPANEKLHHFLGDLDEVVAQIFLA